MGCLGQDVGQVSSGYTYMMQALPDAPLFAYYVVPLSSLPQVTDLTKSLKRLCTPALRDIMENIKQDKRTIAK